MTIHGLRRTSDIVVALDQIVSGVSNFAIMLAITRIGSLAEVGAFTIPWLTYVACLSLLRASAGQVVMIRGARASGERAALRVFVLGGAIAGLGLTTYGCLRGDIPSVLLGISLPALLAQDALRYRNISGDTPARALFADSLWAASTLLLLAWTAFDSRVSVIGALAVWIIGGVASCLPMVFPASRSGTSPESIPQWIASHKTLLIPLAADAAISLIVAQAGVIALGLTAGLQDLGALRAAQSVIAPASSALAAWNVAGLRFVARRRRSGGFRPGPFISTMPTLISVGVLLLLVAPDSMGRALIGPNWDSVRPLLPWLGVGQIAVALSASLGLLVRVAQDGRLVLKMRAITAPIEPSFTIAGALLAASLGAARGIGIAQLTTLMVIGCLSVRRLLREDRDLLPHSLLTLGIPFRWRRGS